MAPKPSIPSSFSDLIFIAPTPTTKTIAFAPTTSLTLSSTATPSDLKTLSHPWDTCATTITIVAPAPTLDISATTTPSRTFTCPATVRWTAGAVLSTATTPAETGDVAGVGSEEAGHELRNVPAWQTALVAIAIVATGLLLLGLMLCVRYWRDRVARRGVAKGKKAALENEIALRRFEGQSEGVIDVENSADGTTDKGDGKGDDGVGKQYLYGGETLEDKDVSDYYEGIKGRF